MRDSFNHFNPVVALAPKAAVADNTAFQSGWIDRKGYESLLFLLVSGDLADADVAIACLVEHADLADHSDSVAVPDELLLGTEALAGFTFANDNACRKVGYVGSRQYVRITMTPAGNAGNIFLAAIALLGHPFLTPTPNPPV